MVIAKPEWFGPRKYTGWGITPKTWQGWVYIAAIFLPFIIFQSLPYWGTQTRVIVTVLWAVFLIIDTLDVMIRMKKDEREKIHEAIAERNALWAVLFVLIAGILYQAIKSGLNQTLEVDWFLVITLFAAVIVKAVSNIYLNKKN